LRQATVQRLEEAFRHSRKFFLGENERMSSVIKKRRKKIRKHKYKKLRRQSRHKKK